MIWDNHERRRLVHFERMLSASLIGHDSYINYLEIPIVIMEIVKNSLADAEVLDGNNGDLLKTISEQLEEVRELVYMKNKLEFCDDRIQTME